MKSKAQPEPRLILAASTNELAQTTLIIPGQFTSKHIHQSPEFSLYCYNRSVPTLATALELVLNEKLKDFEGREYLFH
jgi:hypothetical protein